MKDFFKRSLSSIYSRVSNMKQYTLGEFVMGDIGSLPLTPEERMVERVSFGLYIMPALAALATGGWSAVPTLMEYTMFAKFGSVGGVGLLRAMKKAFDPAI